MTKIAIALAAAALISAPSFSSSAEAGGIRVGFGFPLGSFVARPHQSYDVSPSYRAQKYCAKKAARQNLAQARKARNVDVAEKAPSKQYKAPAAVKTASVETSTVKTDAAPTVYVPEANAATTVKTVDVTPAATTTAPAQTAALAPVETKETVKVEEPKTETVETVTKEKSSVKLSTNAKRVCRRFSAAIAGLIDVPCE
jgi:hypothetical protein